MRAWHISILLLLLVIMLAACSSGVKSGSQAPDFTIKDIFTGDEITLSHFRGRPVLIYFFASW